MTGSWVHTAHPETTTRPTHAPTHTQEKLALELDDGQAYEQMQQLINESATALMPQIMETTHRWAQYWR
jgi:phosphatidylinositol 3-kinase